MRASFRTAMASASYANLTSLYGTFYGQYRHGDAGRPLHAQVLRMLQFERGYYGAGAPPWEQPERYRSNSPIERVGQVKTPLMLIHGEIDFIPIQQAEEFFTAMYRRDQRVKLLRYAGFPTRGNGLQKLRRTSATHLEAVAPGSATTHLGHATPAMARAHYLDMRIITPLCPLPPEIGGRHA